MVNTVPDPSLAKETMKRMCIALLLVPLAAASCQGTNEAIRTARAQTQGAGSTNKAFIQTTTAQPGTAMPAVSADTFTPEQTTAGNAAQEAEIRDLVENLGKRLQDVSLLSPDARQEMQNQYSEFVSPTLIAAWMHDVSKAPGRIVSSPWPDRIEITSLTKEGLDRYVITGSVVEITSVEVVSGGAAVRVPVRIVLQKDQGRWLITGYAEER